MKTLGECINPRLEMTDQYCSGDGCPKHDNPHHAGMISHVKRSLYDLAELKPDLCGFVPHIKARRQKKSDKKMKKPIRS